MPINIDDELLQSVARLLGSDWTWTRDTRGDDPERGWLQSGRKRLFIQRDRDVWVICEALDLRIPEFNTRVKILDLFTESDRQTPAAGIGVVYTRDAQLLARIIRELMLPGIEETLRRFDQYRSERVTLLARRRECIEALQRVCPAATLYWSDVREIPLLVAGDVVIAVLDLDECIGTFNRSLAEYVLKSACAK